MSFWRAVPGGVELSLRVTPNAHVDAVEGVESRADGKQVLRLRVRAVPDKGRANQAVIALLAERLDVARSAIALAAGETARFKSLRIEGEAGALAVRLERLAAHR